MKLAFLLSFAVFQLQLTRPAGLDFLHRNSPTEQRYLIETMGGGVGLIDYNNDGRLDIFLVNSGKLESATKAPVNFARDEPAYWNRLYRQNQNGSFTDVTAASGLSRSGNRYGMGVAVGDYDNDGFADIYVTNFGGNLLYHNNGNGTFSDVTISSRVGATGWSVSAGFFDYDNDGMLDLFVSRYLNYDLAANILCGTPFRSYCRPDWYTGTSNLLYRNEGSGTFRNVSESSGLAKVIGKGMGVAFNDYDNDGFTDIFVANDLMDQFLFHNERDGTFKELGLNAGVALSDDGKPYSGMGAAFADYDNDGLPDIAVSNLALEKWALYRSEGEGTFGYVSLTSGLAGVTVRSSGWGIGVYDFDNDGWKDIFGAQSHVLDNVERINPSLRYLEAPGLYRNVAGRFEKSQLSNLVSVAGRGAAFGDIDNDGTMDVVVSTLGGAPMVLQGKPNQNHWLLLRLIGRASNLAGIGAKVRIGSQHVYVTTSGSYLSASDSRVHFGLGPDKRATVEIVWPSGKTQTLRDVSVDQVMTVREPE